MTSSLLRVLAPILPGLFRSSGFNAPGHECKCSTCIRLRKPLIMLRGGPWDDLHFIDDETEAQRGQALYLRVGMELGCDYRQSGSGTVFPISMGHSLLG